MIENDKYYRVKNQTRVSQRLHIREYRKGIRMGRQERWFPSGDSLTGFLKEVAGTEGFGSMEFRGRIF